MNTLIALLRGINVGGKNLLPMKQLISLMEDIGCQDIKTYIQSGNVVFRSKESNSSRLSAKISSAIKKQHGFEPQILLLKVADLERAISGNPFPEATSDPKSLQVGFLSSVPGKPDIQALETLRKKSERFLLKDRLFYLHAPEGIGRSKLAASAERFIGVSMTARNWRTLCKIKDMLV